MKSINISCALIIGVLTLFSITNVNAIGCNSVTEKKSEIECFFDDIKFIDIKEQESNDSLHLLRFGRLKTDLKT